MYRVISITLIAFATMTTHASAQNQPPTVLVPKPSFLSTIAAKAEDAAGVSLPNAPVRARDARYGRIVATLVTNRAGNAVFEGLDPGLYVVEIITSTRQVLGASRLTAVNAGETEEVVVKLPAAPSLLGTLLLGTSSNTKSPTGLVPTLVSVLPQVVIQSIPAVVPVGDPVSER
jgi:hypothetical protein